MAHTLQITTIILLVTQLYTACYTLHIPSRQARSIGNRQARRVESGVRLVDGPDRRSGLVEMDHGGTWMGLQDDGFGEHEAQAVCRTLLNEPQGHAVWRAKSRFGITDGLTLNVTCGADETDVQECSVYETDTTAGVICGEMELGGVRLVSNRGGTPRGRLELNYGGVWGTVCNTHWTQENSEVVCYELGYTGGQMVASYMYPSPSSTSMIWSGGLACSSYEDSLDQCVTTAPIGQHRCSHDSDVAIVCQEPVAVDCTEMSISGEFMQPEDYDGVRRKYDKNIDPCWILTVPEGNTINITFSDNYEVESSGDGLCRYDRVDIFDGLKPNENKLLSRTCGDSSKPQSLPTGTIMSTLSQVLVHFHSDDFVSKKGFKASFNIVPSTCGVPAVQRYPSRIIGGRISRPHSWPWQVNLKFNRSYVCGGSIISNNYILTASHCLLDEYQEMYDISIVVGNHHLYKDEPNERLHEIDQIIRHPNYTAGMGFNNDIALIRVREPIVYSEHVSPVCLPEIGQLPPEADCVTTGWGSTRDTSDRRELNELDLPILDSELCNRPGWLNDRVNDNMLCAGFREGGRDSCFGDSGGPLVCKNEYNRYQQFGITSWGVDCALPNKPGVYTKVSNYIPWIHETTGGEIPLL